MQNNLGKISTKNKHYLFLIFCGVSLVILFFSLIQLSFFKYIDKWTFGYFFGELKYFFYLIVFGFLLVIMFNLRPHPFITRKFFGSIFFIFSLSFLICLASFKDSQLPSFSKILSDFTNSYKNNGSSQFFNNINIGFIGAFYFAIFSLLSNLIVTLFFGYIVALFIFFVSLSIVVTNHSWYLYYWLWNKLLYYSKKNQLKKEVKKSILEENDNIDELITDDLNYQNDYQNLPVQYNNNSNFYGKNRIEKQKLILKQLQDDEEIYRKAFKKNASIAIDNNQIDEFATKTVEQNLNKTSTFSYFQNVSSDPNERKKLFKIPQEIKENNQKIKKTAFQADRFVTPFKVLTEQEIKDFSQKNTSIEDNTIEVKALSSIKYENAELLDPRTEDFDLKSNFNDKDLESNNLPENFFEEKIESFDEVDEPVQNISKNLVFYRFDDDNYHENMKNIKLKWFEKPNPTESSYTNIQKETIISTFADFNIEAFCDTIVTGPSTLLFEIQTPSTVKINRILSLKDNLKLNLASRTLRILAPIPGKNLIGIEIERKTKDVVHLENCLNQVTDYHPLVLIYGKKTDGSIALYNLKELPHLLVAGATGAGKSVFLNSLITNIIYWYSPNEVQLILVDPKKVELTFFQHVPHLLFPIIKESELVVTVLDDLIEIMNERYHFLSEKGFKNVSQYNKKTLEKSKKLSAIVLIIDELADIMLDVSKKVEEKIQKLAQLGRAAAIHLILATQRPSVNVITGTIKANIVSRISFKVGSQIDSRIILDQGGAEELLGHGDMLFLINSEIHRIQGPLVNDVNLELILNKAKKIKQKIFTLELKETKSINDFSSNNSFDGKLDSLYEEIKEFVLTKDFISASYLQRKYRIGFNRAASILDQLAKDNIVEESTGSRPRKVIK
ncbi:DNA translocase FtsK [symbiont of Argiope bruennichi]|uniref:DNA translocase FtsK n=1 Tax=symbiont of Argiope bruennichi TaxID=2810479 RepID=UPI003DA5F910